MTEEQSRTAAQDVIYLAGCAVRNEIPDLARIEDTEAVYSYAAQHKLKAAMAMALESAGRKDKRSALIITNALKRKLLFEKAYAQVKEELEKAGIWYMPLKGMILKDYYPKPGMREMGDYDILFDAVRAGDVRTIMEGLGFRTEDFDYLHHDIYCKAPFLRFEMHRTLIDESDDERLHAYYRDVEGRLLGDGLEKRFSPEDFYLFLVAHEYKHYCLGGTGLRSLLDTYVVLQKTKLDMDYVAAEASRLGIKDFEALNRSLSLRLFSGGELTAEERELLDCMLSSGVYGKKTTLAQNRAAKRLAHYEHGKLRYALSRFFAPLNKNSDGYHYLVKEFPFFYRHKLLLPVLMVYRIVLRLKSGRLQAEVKALKNAKK